MTDSEFRVWLKGFKSALCGNAPTKDQWEQIVLRLDMHEEYYVKDSKSQWTYGNPNNLRFPSTTSFNGTFRSAIYKNTTDH